MKKTIILSLLMMLFISVSVGLTSCKSCNGSNEKTDKAVGTSQVTSVIVENTISTDREGLFINFGDNVRWFETTITLKDFLNDENCDGSVANVVNTFQKIITFDKGYDTMVYLFQHDYLGTNKLDSIHTWFAEDNPLNEEQITLTFNDAFNRVMESNYPKPHSRYCVLRKEVGPVAANPQYIFGNNKSQLYVDAVTGEVNVQNPAYNKEGGFGKPLGEWP